MNRYKGNSGRAVKVWDIDSAPFPDHAPSQDHAPERVASAPEPRHSPAAAPSDGGGGISSLFGKLFAPAPKREGEDSPFSSLLGGLGGIFKKLSPENLELEDIILMLMLFLMYRESGDEEMLIILGGLFLL